MPAVVQAHLTGGGIASVAVLTGQSYQQVRGRVALNTKEDRRL